MLAQLITDRKQWNHFVECTATGHLCQTYEWSEHGEDVAARAGALHVGVIDQGELVGAILLMQSRVRGIAQPIYYAPRGPVVADPASPALAVLMQGAADFVRQVRGCAIRIEPNVVAGDERWIAAFKKLGYHVTDHTIHYRNVWVLDIRPTEQELLANMKMRWRYNVRLGNKKHLIVREGSGEHDLDTFYALHAETAQRTGFYLYPKIVFSDMFAHYTSAAAQRDGTAEMKLFMAEYAGEVIAAITVARFGEWAWSLHSGQGMSHRNLKPNYALQWHAFQWSKANGCAYYDFRGIPDILEEGQEMYGVYEFKRGFGGFLRRTIPTMDYVINPLQYYPYHLAVDLRRRLANRRAKSAAAPSDTEVESVSEKT